MISSSMDFLACVVTYPIMYAKDSCRPLFRGMSVKTWVFHLLVFFFLIILRLSLLIKFLQSEEKNQVKMGGMHS